MEGHAMEEIEDRLLVKLQGDIDLEHSDAVRRLLLNAAAKGRDLLPVLQSMAHWGRTHMPGTYWPGEGALTADPDDLVSG